MSRCLKRLPFFTALRHQAGKRISDFDAILSEALQHWLAPAILQLLQLLPWSWGLGPFQLRPLQLTLC
eukprot:CAMPEP_0206489554 /NCGR_PEP_ID=MMETSP0324_2-20121206/43343_1 /ASSEMBLY_ACC=CAM_ASM_000836 /TAXON_ID=2866 /ORGANISM="Crypthecodinium cohnii, Strain Seligo" /LENGTH=67 /DNA_ID=CAMNT_0053969323 /DNA_START=143 /DNA_END=346 /DNA_ORIENTATION=-